MSESTDAIDAKLQTRKVYDAAKDTYEALHRLWDQVLPLVDQRIPETVSEAIQVALSRAKVTLDAATEADNGAFGRLPSVKARSSEKAIQEFHEQHRVRELRAGV